MGRGHATFLEEDLFRVDVMVDPRERLEQALPVSRLPPPKS